MKPWEKIAVAASLLSIVIAVYVYFQSYQLDMRYTTTPNGDKMLVNLDHPEWRPQCLFWIVAGIAVFVFVVLTHNMRVQQQRRDMETALGWRMLNDRT